MTSMPNNEVEAWYEEALRDLGAEYFKDIHLDQLLGSQYKPSTAVELAIESYRSLLMVAR